MDLKLRRGTPTGRAKAAPLTKPADTKHVIGTCETLQCAPANQKGSEKAAPMIEPAASAESVQAAVVPFHTSANEAVPSRSVLSSGPRGMSMSSVVPRVLTRLRAPGGSLSPDLHNSSYPH